MQEPKVTRGGNNVWVLPDKEWLEDQYVTQGKARKRIATEIGADGGTVGKWLDELNIPQRGPGKVKPAKLVKIDGILMRPPASISNGKLKYWALPDKAWLEYQYVTLAKSATEIAAELDTWTQKIVDWLHILKIDHRNKEQRGLKHSEQMTGEGNPAYNGGTSRSGQKRDMFERNMECVCAWCGEVGDVYVDGKGRHGQRCSLDLHHKNHKKTDGRPSNLVYLCHNCHMVETGLWHIRKSKKAKVTVANKIITIDFNI